MKRGFTLIEVLVVIGITVVLMAIGVIGYRHINRGMNDRRTEVAFKGSDGLMTAFQNYNGMQGVESLPTPLFPTPLYPVGSSVAAPTGYMSPASARVGPAIENTRKLMAMLQIIPANNTILAGLPSNTLIAMRLDNGVPVNDDSSLLQLPAPEPQPPFTGSNPPSIYELAPLMIDGWGNPLIFVPSGGLTGVSVTVGTAVQTKTVVSADGGPFWASAGEDGNFQTGNDNLYSVPVMYR